MGLAIVGAGVLLLLDNLHLLSSSAWEYWPIGLVLLGLFKAYESAHGGGRLWGGMIALAGLLLLADNLGVRYVNFEMVWALFVIGVGVVFLFRAFERKKSGNAPSSAHSHLSEWFILGGAKRRVDAQDFSGGEVFALCGGGEIDLRNAGMSGTEAVIDANLFCGGMEVRVPETWRVVSKVVCIMGGCDDKTTQRQDSENPPVLIITGFAICGGFSVKN